MKNKPYTSFEKDQKFFVNWREYLNEAVVNKSTSKTTKKSIKAARATVTESLPRSLNESSMPGYFLEEISDAVNPWAICTDSVGRKDKKKYERCVKKVKAKHKIKKIVQEELAVILQEALPTAQSVRDPERRHAVGSRIVPRDVGQPALDPRSKSLAQQRQGLIQGAELVRDIESGDAARRQRAAAEEKTDQQKKQRLRPARQRAAERDPHGHGVLADLERLRRHRARVDRSTRALERLRLRVAKRRKLRLAKKIIDEIDQPLVREELAVMLQEGAKLLPLQPINPIPNIVYPREYYTNPIPDEEEELKEPPELEPPPLPTSKWDEKHRSYGAEAETIGSGPYKMLKYPYGIPAANAGSKLRDVMGAYFTRQISGSQFKEQVLKLISSLESDELLRFQNLIDNNISTFGDSRHPAVIWQTKIYNDVFSLADNEYMKKTGAKEQKLELPVHGSSDEWWKLMPKSLESPEPLHLGHGGLRYDKK